MNARITVLLMLSLMAAPLTTTAQTVTSETRRLYNPYERPKNGPPLTYVFNKANPSWIETKLQDPKQHESARMPDFRFSDDEVLDVMAFLKSVAAPPSPGPEWPSWAAKPFEEMNDQEFDAMLALSQRGEAVWSNARCSICHTVNGPGGELIGGFVDLRVGGIDLQLAGSKLKRDWLYQWLKDPKDYFPLTLMPRFRLTDDEIMHLVEYILRDLAFLPLEDEQKEEGNPPDWSALDDPPRISRGKRLIEMSRCIVCHDIEGIAEVLPQPEPIAAPPPGTFEFVAYDARCLSCHSIQGRGGSYAPDLTTAGSRLAPEWLTAFLQSPDTIRPLLQQMPNLQLSAEEVSIIVPYLVQERRDDQIPEQIPGEPVTTEEVDRGREVFLALGCQACHTVGEGLGGVVGPNLKTVGDRLRPGYIWHHLKNPHAVNPYSPEPDYGLTDDEARALAAFLSTRTK